MRIFSFWGVPTSSGGLDLSDEGPGLIATVLGRLCFGYLRLGHVCSFPWVLYPQFRSSHHSQTLGFSTPPMCPIFADGLQLSTTALLDLFEMDGPDRYQLESEWHSSSKTITHPEQGTTVIRDQVPMPPEKLESLLTDMDCAVTAGSKMTQ